MKNKIIYGILIIINLIVIFFCLNFILKKYQERIKTTYTPPIIPPVSTIPAKPPQVRNILFQYRSSKAKSVEIIGDFNDWSPQPMVKTNSLWQIVIKLEPGRYAYNYIVNGEIIRDPNNSNPPVDTGRGFLSSVLIVKPLE